MAEEHLSVIMQTLIRQLNAEPVDAVRVIATAQVLSRQLFTGLDRWLAATAGLLHRQGELHEALVRIEEATRRAVAESTSRQKECDQLERAAQKRHTDAEIVRQRELVTLGETRDQIKTEIATLYQKRQGARDALKQAQEEHAQALASLARERAEATRALDAARSALSKIREGIPA